ncbi:MAG: leucine-rich repeat domain-containing protein, partial [Desulfobacteraceae bacterium]|nr:leucine-rich repeat domain-containing protein [Desulfobacteraceae bacterium]
DRGVTVGHNCSSSVIFPDENLEAVIRQAINKPSGEIPKSDLQSLTELNAVGKDIKNIEGLQYCTKLDQLDLSHNQISDISAVAGLTNLTVLDLYNNQVSDINAVAGLTNLTVLNLSKNRISDISALAGLNNLEKLYLFGNRISDIKPLADNIGIGSNDTVMFYSSYTEGSNPLSTTSCTVYIPQLQDRGADVVHDCP